MVMYVVTTSFFPDSFFGAYSTIKRARTVIEDYLANDECITSFKDEGNYYYSFTTTDDEEYTIGIIAAIVDEEFERGLIAND